MPFWPPPQFFGVGRRPSSNRVKDMKVVNLEKGAKLANPTSKLLNKCP